MVVAETSELNHIRQLRDADPVAGALEGDLFLVMSYGEGETLQERIARGPLPFADVREIRRDVPEALEAVIDRYLQVGLADRYESAAEVILNW